MTLRKKPTKNVVGKGENAGNQNKKWSQKIGQSYTKLTIPNDKILELSKLIAFQHNKLSVPEKGEFLFETVRNCEKRRKCWFAAFFFPFFLNIFRNPHPKRCQNAEVGVMSFNSLPHNHEFERL